MSSYYELYKIRRPRDGPVGVSYPSPAPPRYEVDTFYNNNGSTPYKVYHAENRTGGRIVGLATTDAFGRHKGSVGYVAPTLPNFTPTPENFDNSTSRGKKKLRPEKSGMTSSEQLHLEKQQIAILSGDKSSVIVQSQYPKDWEKKYKSNPPSLEERAKMFATIPPPLFRRFYH